MIPEAAPINPPGPPLAAPPTPPPTASPEMAPIPAFVAQAERLKNNRGAKMIRMLSITPPPSLLIRLVVQKSREFNLLWGCLFLDVDEKCRAKEWGREKERAD